MDLPQHFSFRCLLLLCFVSFLYSGVLVSSLSEADPLQKKSFPGRRRMLQMEEAEEEEVRDQSKKTKFDLPTKKQTKLIKPKACTNSTKTTTVSKNKLEKLNSTSSSSNSTKPTDLLKLSAHKNETVQPALTKKSGTVMEKKSGEAKSESHDKLQSCSTESKFESSSSSSLKKQTSEAKSKSHDKLGSSSESKSETSSSSSSKKQTSDAKSKTKSAEKKQSTEATNLQKKKIQKAKKPYWMDQEDDADIVSELKDLASKVQESLIPDLQKISSNSQAYLTKANKEMTKGFKPFVGKKYAPTIASILACIFIIVPLILVSLVFHTIKAYFSLQKLLIFIQVYLSIYFLILSLSSLVTGLEPLKFFYATSQSSYVWLQVLQTLGYVLYVLLLLMYLVLVFSRGNGLGSRLLGLGQTMVGFAVGLHYYATVFHRAVLRQPPKTNWKVQGIYAVCFFLICFFVNAAERRKKTYLHDGDEDGKKS